MLNWWLRKAPQTDHAHNENTELLEPPETPAPVFAARALKSAIFGPPTRPDDTIYEDDTADIGVANIRDTRSMSPTKPAGILLTPGTATSRRKTVSFDHDVGDKDGQKDSKVKPASKSGLPDDFPGKFPSPWVAKSDRKPRRKTNLTKTLEASREKSPKSQKDATTSSLEDEFDVGEAKEPVVVVDINTRSDGRGVKDQRVSRSRDEDQTQDSDMTIDLDHPRSKSGKFWKTEFEKYHAEALVEMRKLVHYKNMARSYAKNKDDENLDLEAQLEEEQDKVLEMERKIAMLSTRIGQARQDGNSDEDSPALVQELARQTALARQYRIQVEEFRIALEENGIEAKASVELDGQPLTPRTEQTILDTHHELKKARQQLREMVALRQEVKKLKEENIKVTEQLLHSDLRLERHLEKCEKKQRQHEEHCQKKEDAMQSLQKDYEKLKELLKSSRRDADQLRKKSHDQVAMLRKEIASIRGSDETAQELRQALQAKTLEQEQTMKAHKQHVRDLESSQYNQSSLMLPSRMLAAPTPGQSSPTKILPARENRHSIAGPNISRPLKTFSTKTSLAGDRYNTPRQRASLPALSEIINNADKDTLPPQRYGPVQHTPMVPDTPQADTFLNETCKTPELELPSFFELSMMPEPSRGAHTRNNHPSPRPSMFNIASSPPRAALMRGHATKEVIQERSHSDSRPHRQSHVNSNANSSHLPESARKAKGNLPLERIAAAKARLEAKQVKRKRQQERGKENIRT